MCCLILAGYVIGSLKLTCSECTEFVSTATPATTQDDLTLIAVKNRGGLIQPSRFVHEICIQAEKQLRQERNDKPRKNAYAITSIRTLSAVYQAGLHNHFSCTIHATELIKMIVSRYVMIRLHYMTKSVEANKQSLRQKLNRLVLFNHV
jgi:hypothetical protein